jgi:hypothetical protein
MLVSHEELCSMELVSQSVTQLSVIGNISLYCSNALNYEATVHAKCKGRREK